MKIRFDRRHIWIAIALIVAWIVLPTGTPEDLVTTLLFIKLFGFQAYLLMCGATLLFLGWVFNHTKKRR